MLKKKAILLKQLQQHYYNRVYRKKINLNKTNMNKEKNIKKLKKNNLNRLENTEFV